VYAVCTQNNRPQSNINFIVFLEIVQIEHKIILGIDPGTVIMGYGIIEVEKNNKPALIEMGVLKLAKYKDPAKRLLLILNKVQELVRVHKPTHFAIEAPFYGKNVQSMLKLGRAQGVAIAAAMSAGLEVAEYMPKSVKQSVTGNGNATKEQVSKMVQQVLNFTETAQYLDASDAVSVALCHHYATSGLGVKLGKKNKGGWDEFIKANPGKVKL
jgi:crossover junction endodeoxyribonuclease RuvC